MRRNNARLTAVIIAKNEADRIGNAVKDLGFADTVIVIDNGSTDSTAKTARYAGASVVTVTGDDFSMIRNRGKKEAGDGWILYIDADEQVSGALRREIVDVVSSEHNTPVSYRITRNNTFLGKPWPTNDTVHRLFSPESLVRWDGAVHESPITQGSVGMLKGTLHHDTHRSLEQMMAKTNEWSAIEARLRFDAKHPPVVGWRLIRVFLTGFVDSYISKRGYTAGATGLIESMFQGFSLFITYAKLWELQQVKDKKS